MTADLDGRATRPGATVRVTAPRSPRRAGPPPTRAWPVLLAMALGSLAAVGLGVYGRVHEPTFTAVNVAGFSSGLSAKSWLATGAVVLVLVQLATARPTWRGRPGAAVAHRWSGRAAVLLTVPVAVHCLYALGFQDGTPRVFVHSLAGCAFYGAFVAKMLVLPRADAPRWAVPLLGALLLVVFTAVWLTSALWFFGLSGPVLQE